MFPAAATVHFLCSLAVWLPSPCGADPGHPFGEFGHAPCCASPVCFQGHVRKPHVLPQTESHQRLQGHFVCTGSRDALMEPLGETQEFENSPASPESHPEAREAAPRPALKTMGLDSECGLSLLACVRRSSLLSPSRDDPRAAAAADALRVDCGGAAAADGGIAAAVLTDAVHVDAALFVLCRSASPGHAVDAVDVVAVVDVVVAVIAAAAAAVVYVVAVVAVAAAVEDLKL